jgi:hypothetical protein
MLMQPIHIKLLPSKPLVVVLAGISIACCLVLLQLPIFLYGAQLLIIKCAIMMLIIGSSVFFILRDALLLLPSAWITMDVSNQGRLTMTNKRGQQFQLNPAASSFIHGVCTLLNFNRNGFNWAWPPVILLFQPSDEVRRLRVWLRWAKQLPIQDDLA